METSQNARGGRRATRGGVVFGQWMDISDGKENQPIRRIGVAPQVFAIRRETGKRKPGSGHERPPLIDITYLFLQEPGVRRELEGRPRAYRAVTGMNGGDYSEPAAVPRASPRFMR